LGRTSLSVAEGAKGRKGKQILCGKNREVYVERGGSGVFKYGGGPENKKDRGVLLGGQKKKKTDFDRIVSQLHELVPREEEERYRLKGRHRAVGMCTGKGGA